MGNFVAITASPDLIEAEKLYQRAVDAGKTNAGKPPHSTIRNPWSLAASFPRQNGSGSVVASDAATGSWLGVVGTCFHQSGSNDPGYLLQQYLSHGVDQLANSLEGFFAIIIGDGGTQNITVITDVIGSCHFYCRQFAGATVLSSSSLVLASLADVSLDPIGCQEFVGMGTIYEERTLYQEIKKLPPASIISFSGGTEVRRTLYWDVARLSPESLSAEAAREALWQALVSAADKVGNQFGKLVCDLTGGYDSRAIAAAFLGAGKHFATTVSGPEDSADVAVSRGLARTLDLEHLHNVRADSFAAADLKEALDLTDGEYDLVEYAGIARTHHRLSERFEISINGSFGEMARGYWWELLIPHTGAHSKLDSRKLAERRYAVSFRSDLFQPQLRLDLVDHMSSVIDRATEGMFGSPNTFQMDVAYLRMRMQRWQGRIASSTNRIWPCLSPFMFRPALEVMLQARFSARQRSFLVRDMLARHQPAIANYPLEHGYPAIPATWRNFLRFWTLAPYYGGRVAQKIRSRLSTPRKPGSSAGSRSQVWKSQPMHDFLQSGLERTTAVLEEPALAALVRASGEGDFSRVSEMNRIFTIGLALSQPLGQLSQSVEAISPPWR